LPRVAIGQARQKIRIGVPTKTYWPTIVCETALRQKLFDKEGLDCELTIYRGGAEGFEALAAGAADLVLNSSSSVAAGLKKGVNVRCVANGSNGYLRLVPDGEARLQGDQAEDLAGKKVGITSAGSGSDMLARWAGPGPQGRVHPRAAGRRRTGAEPAVRQYRRDRPLLAADFQGDAGQGGALDPRFRRRDPTAFDGELDCH
jgi:hypothetical protein